MAMWIFMMIMVLLIPLCMIFFGKYAMHGGPKEINGIFGYRTPMSTKNKDTWKFAHEYCGKLWYVCGWILMAITVAAMLCVMGEEKNTVGTVGGIIEILQLIPLLGTIFFVERALNKNFDKNGNRR